MAGSKQRLAQRLAGPKWPWVPPTDGPSWMDNGPARFVGTTPSGLDVWVQPFWILSHITGRRGLKHWRVLKRDQYTTTSAALESTRSAFLDPLAAEIRQAVQDDTKARQGQKHDKQSAPQRRPQQQKQARSRRSSHD